MNALATIGFGVAGAVTVCIAVAFVTSPMMATSEAHSFTNISAPDLWTTTPVKIDRSVQSYERVPAILSTYAANPPKLGTASRSGVPASALAQAEPTLPAEHQTWCAGRYRSFNPQTNTYRSFSGEMRTCMPFGKSSPATGPSRAQQGERTLGPAAPAIASWCAARYQSYRAEDNTYQPYRGPRRLCEGPRTTDQVASRL